MSPHRSLSLSRMYYAAHNAIVMIPSRWYRRSAFFSFVCAGTLSAKNKKLIQKKHLNKHSFSMCQGVLRYDDPLAEMSVEVSGESLAS